MATNERTLNTVRDTSGNIYADLSGARARRIGSLEEYQQGVSEGLYSGTPRQLDTAVIEGPSGGRYLGGYDVGPDLGIADARSGNLGFATQDRTLGMNTPGSAPSKTEDVMSRLAGIVTGGQKMGASGTSTTSSTTSVTPTSTTTSTPSKIPGLRQQVANLQQEAYTKATEFTPEQLRSLTPGQQAELRRQRVTALSGQMGNLQAAIQTLQAEEAAAKSDAEKQRETALETLNTYLQYGVMSELGEDELAQLAATSGLSTSAIKKISEQASSGEPPELRSVGGDLYAVAWNPETGTFESELVIGSGSGGGGGGGGGRGSGGSGSSSGATSGFNISKEAESFLNNYPAEFQRYIYSIVPTYTGTLDKGAIVNFYEQYQNMGTNEDFESTMREAVDIANQANNDPEIDVNGIVKKLRETFPGRVTEINKTFSNIR